MLTNDDILQFLDNLTATDLVALTRAIEAKWGVRAAPAPMIGQPTVRVPDDSFAEDGNGTYEFDLVLEDAGPNKIGVIKVVRELTGFGLKDAKDLVDGAPKTVRTGVKRDVEEWVKKLREAGAKATLK